jgi:hypothetical protein
MTEKGYFKYVNPAVCVQFDTVHQKQAKVERVCDVEDTDAKTRSRFVL